MKPLLVRMSAVATAAVFLGSLSATIFAAETPQPPADNTSTGLQVPAPKPAKTNWMSREAAEVLKLVHANVTEDVVMAFIQTSRTGFNLSADEIVQLHNEGVSDKMIQAMLARRKAAPQPSISVAEQPAQATQPQPLPGAPQVVQQPIAPAPQPSVQYVQSPPVYVQAPTTYVYSQPAYTYYDPYPYYYSSWWYPSLSFNFGWRGGYYGHYGHYGYSHYAHYSPRYSGGYSHGYSGAYRGGFSGGGGLRGGYSGGFHGGHR